MPGRFADRLSLIHIFLPRWKPKSFWFVEIRLYNAAGIYSTVFVTERSISAGVSAVMEVPLIFQMKPDVYKRQP